MKVLVCGSRNFKNKDLLYSILDNLHKAVGIDVIIETPAPLWLLGATGRVSPPMRAAGSRRMAGFWARKNKIDNKKFPADWDKFGKAAGILRNIEMLKEGDPHLVVAFPVGESRGTRHMMSIAKKAGIEVIEVG